MVNVKDYGAVGDRVTDDTEAVQRAINNGSCIYFPQGTYRINKLLTVTEDQTLYGDSSTLKQ